MVHELIEEINLIFLKVNWASIWPVELTGEIVAFAMVFCFVTLTNLERRFPKKAHRSWRTHRSYHTNIGLFVFNSIFITVFSLSCLLAIAEHNLGRGLLGSVANPLLKLLLSLLAFDILLYFWHRACHQIKFLWLFHRVHHSDACLNVSTAFRQHFVEVIATSILKALLILILGVDKMLLLMIEAIATLCIMFQHTNSRFKNEQILASFIMVPKLHKVHHSTERSEYDTNYGIIFSFWDRLFGTLSVAKPKSIGLKNSPPENIFSLIKFGLGWEAASYGKQNVDSMIAEAAYYKAEKRDFNPGFELRDWLEAQAEILKDDVKQHQGRHLS